MNIDPNKFIDAVQPTADPPLVVFGVIDPAYASGKPRVQIDGEPSLSTKQYPYVYGITLQPGWKAVLLRSGQGYVVIGTIVWQ